jgi:hypothetical protein
MASKFAASTKADKRAEKWTISDANITPNG